MSFGPDFKDKELFLLPELKSESRLQLFTLPNPSNIKSKETLLLFQTTDSVSSKDIIYRLQDHSFSKPCARKNSEELAKGTYHYTNESQPIKSMFLLNEDDRKDGYVLESSTFKHATIYDLTYSLIGFYFKNSVTEDEKDYIDCDIKSEESSESDRYLTLRDYHDLLTDSHDKNWAFVSMESLETALVKICDTIEEAGDSYYKIRLHKIIGFLSSKVLKIVDNFPKSLNLPIDYPEDIKYCGKVVLACNLMISLIPKEAYRKLRQSSENTGSTSEDTDILENISISGCFDKYNKYKKEIAAQVAEKELLTQTAMNVGLGSKSGKQAIKKGIRKVTVAKKKVAVGKGAIDGFFKR
ncbi:hypothetical protein KAFR_0E01540 [Kazachstania africana CBS 2517]|uniref:Ribonuclease H2 subunit B n=1 Tax=Kazachstania africana (strain ATCC 22294 / BCRC 22015 / CBS 2517 / CECT 1963 / NBRC 1671 / NRRL Y-8276) TaxID=1071382 RepID=H2AVA8_KAZAF|nr:hypothetical protein KAFR_0E01540 [Kazachstania africana CBS 2517]CCF58308.1 hypothetical protein KAFR_0E01540 [Kazachstania africana CBS 2517]